MEKTIEPDSTHAKTPAYKKWLKRTLVLMLTLALMAVLWVEYQMRTVKGQFTPTIDTASLTPITGTYIIQGADVLNPAGTAMLADQDVLIRDGMIQQVGTDLKIDNGMQIIQGQGKYLIPGLMDGHVHLTENANNLMLYLANGVTHVRDMGGSDYHLRVRDERTDQPLWPDVFVASEKVYTTPWWKVWFMNWTYSRITMSDTAQGTGTVNDLNDRGFDALKISNGLDPAHYRSLVKAAHAANLLITGHIPQAMSIEEVLELGQHEIAHVEEITKVLQREFALNINELNQHTIAEYLKFVAERGREVAQTMQAKGVHVTSVIWLMESLPKQKFELETFLKTVELEYVDPAQIEGSPLGAGWLPGHHSYASSEYWFETEERRQQLWLFWKTYVDAIHVMTRVLVEQGVEITAGTDSVTTGGVPGFSLHDELESMVKLGMTPTQALQTATKNPGQWLSKVNKNPQAGPVGQIKPGYQANLVLLKQNPLDDINHTRTIESVIIHGNLLNRAQLDLILARIKAINDNARTQDISVFK